MTPAETVREARRKMGLSAARFARLLGMTGPGGARLVYKWEAGDVTPSPPALTLARWLAWGQKPSLDVQGK